MTIKLEIPIIFFRLRCFLSWQTSMYVHRVYLNGRTYINIQMLALLHSVFLPPPTPGLPFAVVFSAVFCLSSYLPFGGT